MLVKLMDELHFAVLVVALCLVVDEVKVVVDIFCAVKELLEM
jgi:hypothetical protein